VTRPFVRPQRTFAARCSQPVLLVRYLSSFQYPFWAVFGFVCLLCPFWTRFFPQKFTVGWQFATAAWTPFFFYHSMRLFCRSFYPTHSLRLGMCPARVYCFLFPLPFSSNGITFSFTASRPLLIGPFFLML